MNPAARFAQNRGVRSRRVPIRAARLPRRAGEKTEQAGSGKRARAPATKEGAR